MRNVLAVSYRHLLLFCSFQMRGIVSCDLPQDVVLYSSKFVVASLLPLLGHVSPLTYTFNTKVEESCPQ